MPALGALGRILGAPGTAPFRGPPDRGTARALVDKGPEDNVAVTDPSSATSWLRPILLPQPPDQAHARVLAAIGMLRGWHLAEQTPDVLWATRTTSLLGFVDDVIILLTPQGAGTLIEARSASRIGRRDLGRNRSTLRELRDVLSRWA